MGLAITRSRALNGLAAHEVRVETHLANGLPTFTLVGLPQATVRESRDRVRAAIIESGFDFPNRRITVNLATAELPKDVSRLDLPIAIGILCAAGNLPAAVLDRVELVGELSLTGQLRAITGSLAIACGMAIDDSPRILVLPRANAAEARLSGFARVLGADHLAQVCELLRRLSIGVALADLVAEEPPAQVMDQASAGAADRSGPLPDLDDVVGQAVAKRALEISAAGDHHLLLCGPPGTGKSMLAERLPGLCPPLTTAQSLEHATIASLRRQTVRLDRRAAWRRPHHSTSPAGLIGGGQPPGPGEISLAHHGILFLDELPEFRREALEALREPIETGQITVSRGRYQVTFPAAFVLVAAMNPCPCGFLGDSQHDCVCTPEQIRRYRARLSGPFLDRFDLRVDVKRPGPHESPPEPQRLPGARQDRRLSGSARARLRVAVARARQRRRQGCLNGRLAAGDVASRLGLTPAAAGLARRAMDHYGWSMRALHRTLKVARTIADLDAIDLDAVDPYSVDRYAVDSGTVDRDAVDAGSRAEPSARDGMPADPLLSDASGTLPAIDSDAVAEAIAFRQPGNERAAGPA